MPLPKPRVSADIVVGAKSNRVRVRKPKRRPPDRAARTAAERREQRNLRARERTARTAPLFYRADGTLDGLGVVKFTASFAEQVIARIDRAARRAQMSRSAFMRQAWKHFDADHPLPVLRTRTIMLTIPPRELDRLDQISAKHGRNRSALLLHAALHFCDKLGL